MNDPSGLRITQIIRGSHVDGPGLRTVIFLKGCPLRCGWCHNPETQELQPELLYDSRSCIRCGACVDACTSGAVDLERPYIIDKEKCTACFACVDACPSTALKAAGKDLDTEAVISEIRKDTVFYETSGGGVTFSGGEPLLYHTQLIPVLEQCRELGISVCIDTCLAVPWDHIADIAVLSELFLVDVKHSTNEEVMPETVFSNLEKLAGLSRIWIRIPVIPAWNDTESEMKNIATRLVHIKNGIEQINLLPFHNTAGMKYRYLDRAWSGYAGKSLIPDDCIDAFSSVFKEKGFSVKNGG